MTYQETEDFLFNQLPIYQNQGRSALNRNLEKTILLLKHLGNPHNNFKSVLIAGTNGKGSSCHMIASILQEAGYKTGLHTSPHLKSYTERVRINGVEIEKRLRPTVLIENASINDSLRIEVDAEFPGGHDGWGKHLRKNLKYPLDAKRYGYQGNVYMSFVVLSDGSITSAKIIGSPHEVLSAEALRMLEISPNWIPATVNGVPVDFQLSTLRVVFRLK